MSECINAGYASLYDDEKIAIVRNSIIKMSYRKDSSHPNYVSMLNVAKNALWITSFPKSLTNRLPYYSISDDLEKIRYN